MRQFGTGGVVLYKKGTISKHSLTGPARQLKQARQNIDKLLTHLFIMTSAVFGNFRFIHDVGALGA